MKTCHISAEVTSYRLVTSIDDDAIYTGGFRIFEETHIEEMEAKLRVNSVGETWFWISNSSWSMPFDRLEEAAASPSRGWYAQAGTKPVWIDPCPKISQRAAQEGEWHCTHDCTCGSLSDALGGWGGRNYPQIFVPAAQLERARLILDPDAALVEALFELQTLLKKTSPAGKVREALERSIQLIKCARGEI